MPTKYLVIFALSPIWAIPLTYFLVPCSTRHCESTVAACLVVGVVSSVAAIFATVLIFKRGSTNSSTATSLKKRPNKRNYWALLFLTVPVLLVFLFGPSTLLRTYRQMSLPNCIPRNHGQFHPSDVY